MVRTDAGQAAPVRPVRLVLADDEAMLRRGLRVLLEVGGQIEVVAEAGDGDELLAAVGRQQPDVVLADIQMPGGDGLTALRAVHELPRPPVTAVLTTFDLDEYVADALRVGASGFLLKDADPPVLVRAVCDLAAGGAVLDPRIVARLLPRLRDFGDSSRECGLLNGLSERERQVLDLIASGRSNGDIAVLLGLTEATVKGYVSSVLSKLGAANRVQAALIAQRAGHPRAGGVV